MTSPDYGVRELRATRWQGEGVIAEHTFDLCQQQNSLLNCKLLR